MKRAQAEERRLERIRSLALQVLKAIDNAPPDEERFAALIDRLALELIAYLNHKQKHETQLKTEQKSNIL